MDTLFVLGAESVVGANLAAILADRFEVTTASAGDPVFIEGCRSAPCAASDWDSVRNWISSQRPNWVVVCGAGARSSWDWDSEEDRPVPSEDIVAARRLAMLAHDLECQLTVVSTDAVFTGPWMFHAENSPKQCPSRCAETMRDIERVTRSSCPGSLVVRTNAYGWLPHSPQPGWIEHILTGLENGTVGALDCVRHASPILATDLAEILALAYREGLQGTYHVASAERINPFRFVQRLAEQFDLPDAESTSIEALFERPTGFGRGETSLATKKIRDRLGVSMPMISDGLKRLYQQRESGYCDRFDAMPAALGGKVA